MHEYPPELEQRLRDEARRFKDSPLPDRVKNKPTLFFGNALFLNAWFDLDTERDRKTYQPISRRMCFEYSEDYGLDEEQRDDLWFYMNRMDREFLEWFKKKQPKPRTPKTGKGRGKNA